MIPVHDATGKLVGYFEPDTGKVRDPHGHLLFFYDVVADCVKHTSKRGETVIPLGQVREIVALTH